MKSVEKKPKKRASVAAPSSEEAEHSLDIPGKKRKRQLWEISNGTHLPSNENRQMGLAGSN